MQLANFFLAISIPYGAIKRDLGIKDLVITSEFQFLMVRLKELIYYLVMISIIFQFLMVRLKAYAPNKNIPDPHAFQFLMVRLKGGLIVIIMNYLLNFNSLWCD